MPLDPELRLHHEWLGFVQPVGLVVSPPALAAIGAVPTPDAAALQKSLEPLLETTPVRGGTRVQLRDLPAFLVDVCGWQPSDLAGGPDGPALPRTLESHLPVYEETLRPTFAAFDPEEPEKAQVLLQVLPSGQDFDRVQPADKRRWLAPPQVRFERLLRDTGVGAGLLFNHDALRLVYAPPGETAGHATWRFADLATVPGRPLLAALHMLLCAPRLFTLERRRRLPALLADSRKYQSAVTDQLAGQVLAALQELLRGFQAAHEQSEEQRLLKEVLEDPTQLYGGLLTVLMRLLFLLYAEDRSLMPESPLYHEHYAVSGLFERLRQDAGLYPDTLDERFGAWSQLLVLFRLIYTGGGHGTLQLPARYGDLFSPSRYPFLEGRVVGPSKGERIQPPRVSDGVVFRVLRNLLLLDGERLSYRALDVEHIGSVYERMMGFSVEVAKGRSVALLPLNVVLDLDSLLEVPAALRVSRLKDEAGCALTGDALDRVKKARTVEELLVGLERRRSPLTPKVLPAGAFYLQPGEERRRSGSHYTPRALTAPIVKRTLEPLLLELGASPRPDALRGLRICDPAMGSGAFLVETCRQLADLLVTAWAEYPETQPSVPLEEDLVLHARRIVAQECLYGVDKNPFAVDLARLSLWLFTLAKHKPFTFLDHALRAGDSLVGLDLKQLSMLDWAKAGHLDLEEFLKEDVKGPDAGRTDTGRQIDAVELAVRGAVATAYRRRKVIRALSEQSDSRRQAELLREAEDALDPVRTLGDAVVAAFFTADKEKARKEQLKEVARLAPRMLAGDAAAQLTLIEAQHALRAGSKAVRPFHWPLEFPEVFAGGRAGFDAFVGNPPFAGKNTVAASNAPAFQDWLLERFPESNGNADLVAFFFRRAFELLRSGGTFGLIATNTISQGDTRFTGLRWICTHQGSIFDATRRLKWPGLAAVVVSVVQGIKSPELPSGLERRLDGRGVDRITAFLFHAGVHEDPIPLKANAGKSFQGSIILGMGFTFDDDNPAATPIAEMHRLIEKDPRNAERIFPYLGGEEVNSSPTHAHRRYVINFGEMDESVARSWPDLMDIVEKRVKPGRLAQNRESRARYWWRFGEVAVGLYAAIRPLDRVLVVPRTSKHLVFTFLPSRMVFSENLVVFALEENAIATLHSRIHDAWVRFTSSTLEDRQGYRPSDCFETFPFPENWEQDEALEATGQAYYEFRAALMVRNNQGLTDTYNRFHDPEERDAGILELRRLHEKMDEAVLRAYGWTDLLEGTPGLGASGVGTPGLGKPNPYCDFRLDYEEAAEEGSRRRKPWRYRWSDEFRDEVLGRLMALNAKRAAEEKAGNAGAREVQAAAREASAPGTAAGMPPAASLVEKKGKRGKKEDLTLDMFGKR